MGWLRTTKMAFVATRLGIGYKVCCYGFMGRLRTTRVATSVGEGPQAWPMCLLW